MKPVAGAIIISAAPTPAPWRPRTPGRTGGTSRTRGHGGNLMAHEVVVERSLGVRPGAEVVDSAPDLLAPVPGGVGGEREVGVGLLRTVGFPAAGSGCRIGHGVTSA